jgi:hypothetical protein
MKNQTIHGTLLTASLIAVGTNVALGQPTDSEGPLGEWPNFTPVGYITAPHPNNPDIQTHLYGDWGGIVGEEFIFLQDDLVKLMYHSWHETYMTEHPHELDIMSDWALGYDAQTKIKFVPLVQPGGPIPGPAWQHTDTPGYIQHPLTGEHLLYHTVRPGTKHHYLEWDHLPGHVGAIQVATSDAPPSIGVPFDQSYENILEAELWWELPWDNNGEVKGGLSEPTPVWVPHLGDNGMVRLFYRGLHGSIGSYWHWRISYADSEDGKTSWVKLGTPTFDPGDPDNPAYRWTQPPPTGYNFRGAWQAHCTGDPHADGVHMVMTVSNQNYARGGAIAYYWSPDWGDTWIGHPDNPILIAGTHPDGVPATGFQRTPTLTIDEQFNRYILAYNAGHDINQKSRRRTHLAIADRPSAHCLSLDVSALRAGENGVWDVTRLTPGTKIVVVYSTKLGQTVVDNIAGYCATFGLKGVNQNRVVGFATANSVGVARVVRRIPQSAQGLTIHTQAAQRGTCPSECVSKIKTDTIE